MPHRRRDSANVEVIYAENGRVALDRLLDTPGIDLILMDIIMPEMGGYAAMRAVRQLENLQSLPIIAVTAKAMVGDREICIQPGASDYIPKLVTTSCFPCCVSGCRIVKRVRR